MSEKNEWKLVPVVATDDMEVAAEDDYEQRHSHFPCWKSAYAAMVAAAPAPSAPGDAQDEQVRHKMNADLCAFYMRWEADGDYLRCLRCKRPQIASYAEKGFPHAAGCKAVGNVEQRPWLALIELMRPLIGSAAPAAGDALALEDLQKLIEYAQTSDDCQYGTLSTGLVRDLTTKAIAALAAPVPQQGEA